MGVAAAGVGARDQHGGSSSSLRKREYIEAKKKLYTAMRSSSRNSRSRDKSGRKRLVVEFFFQFESGRFLPLLVRRPAARQHSRI